MPERGRKWEEYFLEDKLLKQLQKKYPKGTKVKLLSMKDPQAPPVGTIGKICGVEKDVIRVKWQNGSDLSLILDLDSFQVLGG
ncbi:MAG: DUF4314 domain-containing protein [Selenomonadaceae bacterium]|nr:DUF4314 domain-containing protein [Selenomonadaceae bacterium]